MKQRFFLCLYKKLHLLATISCIVPIDSVGSLGMPNVHLISPLFFSSTRFMVNPHWPASKPSPKYAT